MDPKFSPALPDPPRNCEVSNRILHCEPGHDGGLPQRFLLEALEVRTSQLLDVDNEISTLNDQVSAVRCAVLGKEIEIWNILEVLELEY